MRRVVRVRGWVASRWSKVDTEAALGDELAFELHQATETEQALGIGLALARSEHAHAVDERGDLRSSPAAQVLAEGPCRSKS